MSDTETRARATALAGGAICAALLETLFNKGILTLDESRDVLMKASRSISPVISTPEGVEASKIIGLLLTSKFSARG